MVKCVGHFCTQKRGATWTKKTDEIDAKLHSGPSNHAEQLAYRQMDSINQGQWIYAFVQNDFPCEPCRAYFETQSSKKVRTGGYAVAGDWAGTNERPISVA